MSSSAEIDWMKQGCEECRSRALSGSNLPRIAVSNKFHSKLHCCPVCQSFWQYEERSAHVISRSEAERIFEIDLENYICIERKR
jgi:hypothetical protein